MLACETVVRPANVGATLALVRDTPWPSRESLYLHQGHSSSRFATVSPGGLTGSCRKSYGDPGISRCCFAAQCVPAVLNFLKPPGPHPSGRRFNRIYPLSMWVLPVSLQCGPGGSRCPHLSDAGTVNIAYTLSFPQC